MLKATTLRLDKDTYKDIDKMAKKEYIDISSFLRKLIMISYTDYKLEQSLKEWSKGHISIGDVADENNISIWQAMEEAKKRRFSSAITLNDIENNNFEL